MTDFDHEREVDARARRRPDPEPLTVGPADDRFEREADDVAERVVHAINTSLVVPDTPVADAETGAATTEPTAGIHRSSRVQRAASVGSAGGALDTDTAARVDAARAGGSSMPRVMRSTMESAFGADFGGVRLHTGTDARDLNERMGAEAFTIGSDVFFRDGTPDVSRTADQQLVAHELTHTIQQGAASQTGAVHRVMQRKTIGTAPALLPPTVRERGAGGAVQARFSLKKKMKQLFGRGSRDDVQQTEIESPVLDGQSLDQVDEYARSTKGSGPGENPDYSNTKLWGAQPDGFRITLAVAQDRPDWMADVKALKRAALANPGLLAKALQGAQVHVPDPSGSGTIAKDPKDVVMALAHESREAERATEGEATRTLEQFSDGIHDVGHTWVRLDTLVGGQVKERYSYGMWPQKVYDPANDGNEGGYAGFIDAGPGEVRHPDTAHEGDALTAYQDYHVGRSKFDAALGLAIQRYRSPPPYVLTGYNCTAFAREVVKAGGGSYPGSGLLPGFAYTPGSLYAAILKRTRNNKRGARQGAADGDGAITDRIDARHKAWKRAGKDAADQRHFAATGQRASRTDRKQPATPAANAPEVTMSLWNGTFTAPEADSDPFTVVAYFGTHQFRPTGNRGNGFIEVTDLQSDFFWIREDEFLAGGTRQVADTPAPAIEAVPFESILSSIRAEGFDGMGCDMIAQIVDLGDYGFTTEDISIALKSDTENRARQLAQLLDGTDDTFLVMSWFGPR